MNKILVAMSGGVDSTAALLNLKKEGYDADGVIMKLNNKDEYSVEDAKKAADKIGAKLYVLDAKEEFEKNVINYFIEEYKKCRTPNPCVVCNITMKFGMLLDFALEKGYSKLATGHYAKIEKSGDKYLLKKADDLKKDQSYMLYGIKKEKFANIMFPLADKDKTNVREVLDTNGFENARKKDSQDICFVGAEGYYEFILKNTNEEFKHGEFCDINGNVLGEHKGLIKYTIGQRKGLGLALPAPMYVTRLDKENNKVILGYNDDLFTKRLYADNINLIAVDKITDGMKVKAKTRYNMIEQPARVYIAENSKIMVEFDEAQRAITPGQSVVLYDEDIVIGGGTII